MTIVLTLFWVFYIAEGKTRIATPTASLTSMTKISSGDHVWQLLHGGQDESFTFHSMLYVWSKSLSLLSMYLYFGLSSVTWSLPSTGKANAWRYRLTMSCRLQSAFHRLCWCKEWQRDKHTATRRTTHANECKLLLLFCLFVCWFLFSFFFPFFFFFSKIKVAWFFTSRPDRSVTTGAEWRGTARQEKKKTRSRNTASQGTSLVTCKTPLSVQDCNSCLPPFWKVFTSLSFFISLHLWTVSLSPIFWWKAAKNSKAKPQIIWTTFFQFHSTISLPVTLRNVPTLSQFKSQLKTFLFAQAFL